MFLKACVSFKVTILKPEASAVTSENSSPLLRKEARQERIKLALGPKQGESGNIFKKSKNNVGLKTGM